MKKNIILVKIKEKIFLIFLEENILFRILPRSAQMEVFDFCVVAAVE
jgi:hypothetical protein